ncbi:MAG: nucleotidyl transferase AbiEii/AbiGii toxin family protein, partial [Thermoanaerobaculia bacterium]
QHQAYFSHLEFDLFEVPSMEAIEMIAEKVRAAFQRTKVRDLYDLHRFASTPFNGELLRRLVVLKLWQVRDPFDPQAFFSKLRGGDYDWENVQRLVRASHRIEPEAIVASVESRFQVLNELTELEQEVTEDAKSGWNEPLAEQLRALIRELAARDQV